MQMPPVLSAVDGKIIAVQFSVLHLTFSTMALLCHLRVVKQARAAGVPVVLIDASDDEALPSVAAP